MSGLCRREACRITESVNQLPCRSSRLLLERPSLLLGNRTIFMIFQMSGPDKGTRQRTESQMSPIIISEALAMFYSSVLFRFLSVIHCPSSPHPPTPHSQQNKKIRLNEMWPCDKLNLNMSECDFICWCCLLDWTNLIAIVMWLKSLDIIVFVIS